MLYLPHDQYIGRSLDVYGEFSEGECTLFAQLLRPGDVTVEVGANLGALTVPLARMVGPEGRIMAFEPQRVLFQFLCANLVLNELFNVSTMHGAVGRSQGMITVPRVDYRRPNNFGGLHLGGATGDQVPLYTLDGFDFPRIKLLKVDVEGMEAEVLAGARETLRQHRPVLYVENDRRPNSPALIRLVHDLGYRAWWHLPPLFAPDNFAGKPENVFGGVVSINLLCLPAEATCSVTGLRPVSHPEDWWKE